jgi:beta-phosphoglucomutase-like phosphatase (HAD superfamily)
MLGSVGVVLFDVDGVLRDSYHAHLTVWRAWWAGLLQWAASACGG